MNTVQNIECVTDLSLLVNTSLVDVVADKIRQNIYTGKYEAGKKLIVRELSEEFGVSHTPVKDALNRLISEGYVEALPAVAWWCVPTRTPNCWMRWKLA